MKRQPKQYEEGKTRQRRIGAIGVTMRENSKLKQSIIAHEYENTIMKFIALYVNPKY